MPLVDPTGSRRFICVMVDGNIDFRTPIEYGQLYAQLKYEVEQQRERYYLTKDEEHELMQHNLRYQRLSGLGEMLLSVYEKPLAGEEGQWLSIPEISARLKQASTAISETDAAGFYRMHIWKTTGEADVAAKNTMPKNSAYLLVPTEELPIAVWDMQQGASSGARQNTLGIRYSNGQSTSIEDVDTKAYQAVDKGTASDSGETWYTLSGIRLARRPSKEGLYICNGRKVLIKQ